MPVAVFAHVVLLHGSQILPEHGVLEAQRLELVFPDEFLIRHARHRINDHGQKQEVRGALAHVRSGGEFQIVQPDQGKEFRRIIIPAYIELGGFPVVRNAGGMLKKLEHGDILPGFRQAGHIAGHLVMDVHFALFHELEGGNGGISLGDFRRRPQGIGGRQQARFRIGQAVSYHAGNVGGLDNRKGHAGNFFLLHEVVNQLVHGLPKVLYPGISAALSRELDGCRFLSGHFGGDVICMCGKAAQHARACENSSC